MSYVRETLAPNEYELLHARFNWTYSLVPWFWTLLGFAPLFYAGFMQGYNGVPLSNSNWLYGLCLVPALAGAAVMVRHIVHLMTTEIVVTTSRFVYKTGLMSRTTKEISLNNIEEIDLKQSVLGRIFGYGHMTLRGTGVGVIQLPDIHDPVTMRRCIEAAKLDSRKDRGAKLTPEASLQASKIPAHNAPKLGGKNPLR